MPRCGGPIGALAALIATVALVAMYYLTTQLPNPK